MRWIFSRLFPILLFSFLSSFIGSAQITSPERVSQEELGMLIEKIVDSLNYYYVKPVKGKEIGDFIKDKYQSGGYNQTFTPKQLAKQLTKDLRSINGDLHLYVTYKPREEKNTANQPRPIDESKGKKTNYGFQEIKFIEDNIGYLKINHFSSWDFASKARQKVSEIMNLMGTAEALIIDVRDNRGGVPYLVSYLVSYLFDDEPVHLADYYIRHTEYQYGIYTEPFVPGSTYPDLPVFVLVNKNSASAAEELAFWLQNHKRATIIGEKTAGAGYGAMIHQLSPEFTMAISNSTEIDPISKKEFEGIGIIPDISTSDFASYEKAIELARKAIIESRKNSEQKKKQLQADLHQLLEQKQREIPEGKIFEQVLLCQRQDALTYDDINTLGYQYMEEPPKAIEILKVNVIQYSYYPNSFDSLADAFAAAKEYDAAMYNYERAVQLAILKKNPNKDQFIQNRDAFKAKYEALPKKESKE